MILALLLTLAGQASVIDGDTLRVQGQVIRLYGIDAPEKNQRCTDGEGKRYLCGIHAARELKRLVKDQVVTCKGGKRDRYRRLIATCFMHGADINAFLVRQGLAVDYTRYSKGRYAQEETNARAERLGVWAGEFQTPWSWRRAESRK